MKKIKKVFQAWIIALFTLFLTPLIAQVNNFDHPPTTSPNIVILLADDLGYGDLACYGNKEIRTPNLDQLAKEGMLFTDCYASAPMCSPSRAGLLTGRIPNRTGIYDWIAPDSTHYLHQNELTIATVLKENGYATSLFGKWHLNGTMGTDTQTQPDDHGFEYYFATQYSANHLTPMGFYRNGKKLYQQHGYSCDIVTNDAIRWLKTEWDKNKPFFQYIAFHEVHEPIASPPDLLEEYCASGKKMLYYANVTNLDRAIGNYMAELDDMGLTQNTLIFFTSDNGPAAWSNGYFERSYGVTGPLKGRKRYLWEGGIRVPGIIRWPSRVIAGEINSTPISNVDLFPTISHIAGINIPEDVNIDGSDITPVLYGKSFERKIPLSWHFYAPIDGPNSVLREGDWIITACWDGGEYTRGRFRNTYVEDIKSAELTDFELYNIKEDIGQDKDLKSAYPKIFVQLKEKLITVHKDVKDESPWQ